MLAKANPKKQVETVYWARAYLSHRLSLQPKTRRFAKDILSNSSQEWKQIINLGLIKTMVFNGSAYTWGSLFPDQLWYRISTPFTGACTTRSGTYTSGATLTNCFAEIGGALCWHKRSWSPVAADILQRLWKPLPQKLALPNALAMVKRYLQGGNPKVRTCSTTICRSKLRYLPGQVAAKLGKEGYETDQFPCYLMDSDLLEPTPRYAHWKLGALWQYISTATTSW